MAEGLVHGKTVDHTFNRTVIVGDHVFFEGPTQISEHLLNRHKAEVQHQRDLQQRVADEQGMSVEEMLESRRVGVIAPSPVNLSGTGADGVLIGDDNGTTENQDSLNNQLAKGFAGEDAESDE